MPRRHPNPSQMADMPQLVPHQPPRRLQAGPAMTVFAVTDWSVVTASAMTTVHHISLKMRESAPYRSATWRRTTADMVSRHGPAQRRHSHNRSCLKDTMRKQRRNSLLRCWS